MRSTPLLLSLSGPLWPRVVASDSILSTGKKEINSVLMFNWVIWIGTFFWHWNCVLLLNWIVWNRTVFCIKMDLTFNNLQCWYAIPPPPNSQVHSDLKVVVLVKISSLGWIDLFEKLFIFDRIMCENLLRNDYTRKCKYERTMNVIP